MTENEIQKQVFAELRARAMPGVVAWHVPNGPEARRKSGYREGVHDVHLLRNGEFFTLELKTESGRPGPGQEPFADDVRAAGGESEFAYGLDEALSILEYWGILRRAA